MPTRVSIVIKAYNEEAHVADAVRSALAALERLQGQGEVILADSASTDRTVEIASGFPITIVQLANPQERRCGIGPQLGFQYATGDYVYILDGDMELDADFIQRGVAELDRDPVLGGVAGLVEQMSNASYQFRGLKRRRAESRAGDVRWLDMGGLYRRRALDQAGYFSDRNLHAFEELELGFRLGQAGWVLRRLPVPAVRHRGYQLDSLALLRRRWRTRYLYGAGEVLWACWRRPYFLQALATQKYLVLGLALWAGLLAGLLLLPVSPWLLAGVLVALLLLVTMRAWRTGSLKDAVIGQVVWQVHAIAMVRGVLAPKVDPRRPVPARLLKTPAAQHPEHAISRT
jgi:glycosyltransferase involved in cell wall biosynthesis